MAQEQFAGPEYFTEFDPEKFLREMKLQAQADADTDQPDGDQLGSDRPDTDQPDGDQASDGQADASQPDPSDPGVGHGTSE